MMRSRISCWAPSVAPHWGAWIEIARLTKNFFRYMGSHPTGVRGLKCQGARGGSAYRESHPTGVRGLKCKNIRAGYNVYCRTPLGCVD